MLRREEKKLMRRKGSLNVSGMVQYITSETNRERYDYYNEEVSFLSKLIVMLSIISAVFSMLSIFNTFSLVNEQLKIFYFLAFSIIFFAIVSISSFMFRKFNKYKNRMNKILNLEGEIIEDMLNGKLKDPIEIKKRYMNIWENK